MAITPMSPEQEILWSATSATGECVCSVSESDGAYHLVVRFEGQTVLTGVYADRDGATKRAEELRTALERGAFRLPES